MWEPGRASARGNSPGGVFRFRVESVDMAHAAGHVEENYMARGGWSLAGSEGESLLPGCRQYAHAKASLGAVGDELAATTAIEAFQVFLHGSWESVGVELLDKNEFVGVHEGPNEVGQSFLFTKVRDRFLGRQFFRW